MKCLLQFKWVKLPRAHLPAGKGIMAHWAKLAARAAFRKGNATYCGYTNEVDPGMWSGGIVGLKSILGIKNREKVLEILDALSELGYIQYSLDKKTKKLSYQISDWVIKCSGAECMDGSVYATDGYGFLCLPRKIIYITDAPSAIPFVFIFTANNTKNITTAHAPPTLLINSARLSN